MPDTTGLVESELKPFDIPLKDIFSDNDFNCRGEIVPIDVIDLARSIEANGLQQSILVQPWNKNGFKWRILSGHRRYMAFKINKAKTIPAAIREGLTELQARKMNLEENLKRKDLNILQEARALIPYWQAKFTEQMVAEDLGQSRGWVQTRKALLNLPEEIQREAAAGFLTQDQVKQLANIKSVTAQYEAVKKIKNAKLLGEKKPIIATRKKNVLAKRARQPHEIFEMQDQIQKVFGNSFTTFALGWAAGHNSDFEMFQEIKRLADEAGIPWSIPREVLDQI